jgi:hypothetical protein
MPPLRIDVRDVAVKSLRHWCGSARTGTQRGERRDGSNRRSNFDRRSPLKLQEEAARFFGRSESLGAKKRRISMSKRMLNFAVAAVIAAGIAGVSNVASATPVADALAIRNAVPASVEAVRWGGHGWGGHGWGGHGFGWGVGAGLLGGAILGGALAAPYYYGYNYYPPTVYGPGYYPAPVYGGDGVAYCARRYRSYDPASGTFLGYDGVRHSCP